MDFAKTVVPSRTGDSSAEDTPSAADGDSEEELDFELPQDPDGKSANAESPSSDTAPTMIIPTIEPPQLPPVPSDSQAAPDSANQTTRSIEPTIELGAVSELMKSQPSTDAYMMQTLPSAPNQTAIMTNPMLRL